MLGDHDAFVVDPRHAIAHLLHRSHVDGPIRLVGSGEHFLQEVRDDLVARGADPDAPSCLEQAHDHPRAGVRLA